MQWFVNTVYCTIKASGPHNEANARVTGAGTTEYNDTDMRLSCTATNGRLMLRTNPRLRLTKILCVLLLLT